MGEQVVNGDTTSYNKYAYDLPMTQASIPLQKIAVFSFTQDPMGASRVFIPKLSTTRSLHTASFGLNMLDDSTSGSNKIWISMQERYMVGSMQQQHILDRLDKRLFASIKKWYWEYLKTLFRRYYHYHSSTSRDGVYCPKGEGHGVLAEIMFGSRCDFGLKIHPLIVIGEQSVCSTHCRAILYSTWRDGGYLHGNVAGPTASGCQSQLGRGSYGSPKTGVLMPHSSGRLEGSACASFFGCALKLLLYILMAYWVPSLRDVWVIQRAHCRELLVFWCLQICKIPAMIAK
ncbi:predicted protein [Lichtheimia corymbifera JMRC:FSU:9682]|uniref:Uncharacterized protein n=1 Tax=Lichtheimia corymbifera JMRC:FSU:9682 TaxID=1263082 RepID=A0A068SIL5_9FUNG|nr:predicted protein [Lichtheimia corymbifera JMRC:FSU:9682]